MDRSLWSRLNWPHVALVGLVIAGTLGALGIVLAWTPPELLERLLELNWPAVGLGAVSFLVAVYGMLRRAGILHGEPTPAIDPLPSIETGLDDEPTHPMGPRALDRRDRLPGDRRRGAASPVLVLALVVLALVIVVAGGTLLGGCGASAVRVHATSATIATASLSTARPVLLRAADAAIARCEAGPVSELAACLDREEDLARRGGLAFDAARLAVAGYRETVDIAALADDEAAAAEALRRAKELAVREVGNFIAIVRELDPDSAALLGAVATTGGAQ